MSGYISKLMVSNLEVNKLDRGKSKRPRKIIAQSLEDWNPIISPVRIGIPSTNQFVNTILNISVKELRVICCFDKQLESTFVCAKVCCLNGPLGNVIETMLNLNSFNLETLSALSVSFVPADITLSFETILKR